MKRHRHQEWIKFVEKIEASTDRKLDLHPVADFTPTSSSWLNLVERWFREITQKRLRRGTFRSVRELIEALVGYVEAHNEQAQGMNWKALPDEILAKVRRARAVLDETSTA